MRATNDTLGERYIIVVARELSRALEGLHDAGIMHRDIKGKFCIMMVMFVCQLWMVVF
jgi:serine/threonine protein kinase